MDNAVSQRGFCPCERESFQNGNIRARPIYRTNQRLQEASERDRNIFSFGEHTSQENTDATNQLELINEIDFG